MQSESQNIEYKESWHDEYLKWICGFANAHGGRIYIGVNDDKKVVGLSDAKRLMEWCRPVMCRLHIEGHIIFAAGPPNRS